MTELPRGASPRAALPLSRVDVGRCGRLRSPRRRRPRARGRGRCEGAQTRCRGRSISSRAAGAPGVPVPQRDGAPREVERCNGSLSRAAGGFAPPQGEPQNPSRFRGFPHRAENPSAAVRPTAPSGSAGPRSRRGSRSRRARRGQLGGVASRCRLPAGPTAAVLAVSPPELQLLESQSPEEHDERSDAEDHGNPDRGIALEQHQEELWQVGAAASKWTRRPRHRSLPPRGWSRSLQAWRGSLWDRSAFSPLRWFR